MTRISTRKWSYPFGCTVLCLTIVVATVKGADVAAVQDLPQLAEAGQFDQVLTSLKSASHRTDDPQVRALIDDLRRYRRHRGGQADLRHEACEQALEDMAKSADEGNLNKALIHAVEAHSLATDPPAVLADETVLALVGRAVESARAAEQAGDWVQALSLYRGLDLLYEDHQVYHDDVKRAARHTRVLQLYAPDRLQQLYLDHAKRLNKGDDPDPITFDDESWQQRFQGVKLTMLWETLVRADRRHVSNTGYRALLRGAIEAVLILVDTDGLADTFASLDDPIKRNAFRNELIAIRNNLDTNNRRMRPSEANNIVRRIVKANNRTLALPERVLVFEMTEGVVGTLDDFSAVIWPHDVDAFSRNTQGKFTGVGISIERRKGQLIVVSPLLDTPAFHAGIKAGDVIATVDGRDTSTWTLDRAVSEITGPEGTEVALGIERGGDPDLLVFPIKRAEIVIESIRGWQHDPGDQTKWDYFIDPDLGIGYVRLSQFLPQTADDLDQAINQMQDHRGLNALILDLRFNPGGLLSAAIEVADHFLTDGSIVSTVDAQGKQTSNADAHKHRTHPYFPVVVLINQGAASASEIVAGALQAHGRALIVGTRSFGKGSVQDLYPLDDAKAYLKLTTQYYMLPNGRIIHRNPDSLQWGVEPDLDIDVTNQLVADALEFRQQVDVIRDVDEPADPDAPKPHAADILKEGLDPQLDVALLVLKTRLVAHHIALAQNK